MHDHHQPAHHPLIERLRDAVGAVDVTPASAAAWEAEGGTAVLLFAGDPVRFPEALNVAVVLPELRAHFGRSWRVGLVPRTVEDALAARYAVQHWPSLVFLRDGAYLGAVRGMQDWDPYRRAVADVLAATPGRRPAPVFALHDGGAQCH